MVSSNLPPNLINELHHWADHQFQKGATATLEVIANHFKVSKQDFSLEMIDQLLAEHNQLKQKLQELENPDTNPLVQGCLKEISRAISGEDREDEVSDISAIMSKILGFGGEAHHRGAATETSHNKEICIECLADKELEKNK